jgi:polysaccharide export outer membrane protein
LHFQVKDFMHFYSKNHLKRWSLLGLIPLLAACAVQTGMRMGDREHVSEQADSGVVPILKPITLELLQTERTIREQQASQDISHLIASPAPYRIDSGDILSVVVWDHPELSTPGMTGASAMAASGSASGTTTGSADSSVTPGFVVDQDGMVQFPYVGPLKLGGLTEAQARSQLIAKLARYLKKPDLTLRVQAYRSKRVYLDGEVKTPGIQAINDIPMTLVEALNRAGGFLPSSDQSRIEISRAGETHRVNLSQLVRKGINPSSILLTNGDVVRVLSREESKVFVLGDVSRPTTLTLRNGRLTLNEALGDAGGISQQTSDGRLVYIVRNAQDMNPIVYHLDARSPVALALAENFELRAKDVVFVDAAPLAIWNRVISLVLPSAQTVTSAVQVTK